MDPLLLKFYERELQFIKEMGAEFSREFPKIAGRLGIDGAETSDPYVERLYEGFAFLAARVHLRVDAEYPQFTQNLLNIIYPQYLSPLPSMCTVQFHPNTVDGLEDGVPIPRDTRLRSNLPEAEQTACEYRTAHDVTLWPLEIVEAEYINNISPYADVGARCNRKIRAGLRFRIQSTSEQPLSDIFIDSLPLYLNCGDAQAMALYEQLIGNTCAVVHKPIDSSAGWQEILTSGALSQVGFDDDQALLPVDHRTFSGYRLLAEYFAFPGRYLFIKLEQLQRAFANCRHDALDIVVLFDQFNPELENRVTPQDFALHCTPAINLFPKRCDRIHLDQKSDEYHVVADRTRPMDFEVYQVSEVIGHGAATDQTQPFLPFYACNDLSRFPEQEAFYTERRERRVISSKQRRQGPRSSYTGSETFVSLVDVNETPYSSELKQLEVKALCTNRDLPLHLPVGKSDTDFMPDISAPVDVVRCIKGPTRPRPSYAHNMGQTAWRLINHLSLNYLSLIDQEDGQGADALRDLLGLYGDKQDATFRKQVEGVRSVHAEPVTRRMPIPGPIAFGRGLRITVTMTESAFVGSGIFLLGSVLERFFARYVSINSFTETVVCSDERGEVMRWPVRVGQQQIV